MRDKRWRRAAYIERVHVPLAPLGGAEEASNVVSQDGTYEVTAVNQPGGLEDLFVLLSAESRVFGRRIRPPLAFIYL